MCDNEGALGFGEPFVQALSTEGVAALSQSSRYERRAMLSSGRVTYIYGLSMVVEQMLQLVQGDWSSGSCRSK